MHSVKRYNAWRRKAGGAKWLAGGLGFLLGLLLTIAGVSATGSTLEGEALACPSGQTTWLRGSATPGSALLARFNDVLVGGGSAGADGTWAIPIAVRERPGVYPVAVLERAGSATVASFICYVNLPVGATSTATPSPGPTVAPVTTTATTLPPTPSPTTPTNTPSPTASSSETAVAGSLQPTATPEPTFTLAPTEPPSTTPLPGENSAIVLAVIQADDPEDPELFEYALLENTSSEPQSLAGWRLVHTGSGEGYAFPQVTIPVGELLVIWSGDGQDDPATGTRYWPPHESRWAIGDTAELHDANGGLVSTLVVSAREEAEE